MVLQDTTQFLVERQPEKLLAWLGNDAGSDEIRRMAGVTDRMLLEQWITYLPTVTGFLYPDAFRRLAIWLLRFSSGRYPVSELAATLFAWIKETDWKQQTPQQMEDYLFIRLYGGYNNSFTTYGQSGGGGLAGGPCETVVTKVPSFSTKGVAGLYSPLGIGKPLAA